MLQKKIKLAQLSAPPIFVVVVTHVLAVSQSLMCARILYKDLFKTLKTE